MRKEGRSYDEIYKSLHIPRSTLSHWFSKEAWSEEVRARVSQAAEERRAVRLAILNKVRGEHLARAYETARSEAARELAVLKYDPLFISGVMLYWGEGAKDPKQGVKFTNSDPKMVRFYTRFLLKSCRIPVEKIKAHVLISEDHEEKTTRAYWIKITELPRENFTKSSLIAGRHAKRRFGWGVCTITVSSTYFKQKILEWIRLLPEELLEEAYYENIA